MNSIYYLVEDIPSEKADELMDFLIKVDDDFVPKLSDRIKNLSDTNDAGAYAKKLSNKSTRIFAIDSHTNYIIGMIAFYSNDNINRISYIPILAVLKDYRNKGIGKQLLVRCLQYLNDKKFQKVSVKTWKDNSALLLYQKFDFIIVNELENNSVLLEFNL